MQPNSGATRTRVGLFSTEPMRLMGVISAFEDHPSIRLHFGEIDTLLEDRSLPYLILDMGYEGAWLETQIRVRRVRPDMGQILLGPAVGEEILLRSIAAGGRAYLDSNCGPLALRQAVESVIQGCIWAPRRVLTKLIDRLLLQGSVSAPLPTPTFSPRERQVLDLIMTACSNREIAEQLGIEERTVKAYVASLMRKTGSYNRVSLSVQATQSVMRGQRRSYPEFLS
jgi:DNA-binding NarL/FixJ family response regulator